MNFTMMKKDYLQVRCIKNSPPFLWVMCYLPSALVSFPASWPRDTFWKGLWFIVVRLMLDVFPNPVCPMVR